jgi:hypothetical protein
MPRETDAQAAPEFLYQLPEDLSPDELMHVRAQKLIQAAFYLFGDPDEKPGTLTAGRHDLQHVLELALAMLLASDDQCATKKDIREAAEEVGKRIRLYVRAMRVTHDTSGKLILEALGIDHSSAH